MSVCSPNQAFNFAPPQNQCSASLLNSAIKFRGRLNLELRCPSRVDGITADPDPDWNFDALLSELNSMEDKHTSIAPVSFSKSRLRDSTERKSAKRSAQCFVMNVLDDEIEDSGSDREDLPSASLVAASQRLSCDEFYLSSDEDSDYTSAVEVHANLMKVPRLSEAALSELAHEHQLGLKEEIGNQFSVLEMDLAHECREYTSAFDRVEKYQEARREVDRKHDTLYQRKLAEALDNHLTAVQRDHELRSQMEERRIRSDAAFEEAKRKEKALQEEKLRQKAKAEAEAAIKAEEARRALEEAERRALKEAEVKIAAESSKSVDAGVKEAKAVENQVETVALPNRTKPNRSSTCTGNVLRAAENALTLEQGRLQMLKKLEEENQTLRSNKDFSSYERHVARLIRQIRGTKENVRAKASELIKIFRDPLCPQSISAATFAKKVVSYCESHDNAPFACGHVIVLFTSQVPNAMDLLLAEFHKACIYTVPKHITFSEKAFESRIAYYKAIGFREKEGEIENLKDYLKRLESYMRLYGALVQTEIPGVQNSHGLKEGWAWIARFLNALPPNIYTAVALLAFLQTAGYGLFKKYRVQFMKILMVVHESFLVALKKKEDPNLKQVIAQIQSYIDDKKFLQEPEGRELQGSLLSSVMVPETDYQDQYGRYHY